MSTPLTYAKLSKHSWQLVSGEARHAEAPATFWIPDLKRRQRLKRGQSVKLIFEIEGHSETDEVEINVERMWVLVTECVGQQYIGVLDNGPMTFQPAKDEYLVLGAEIPFGPEHVINIQNAGWRYWWKVRKFLNKSPTRRWPRA